MNEQMKEAFAELMSVERLAAAVTRPDRMTLVGVGAGLATLGLLVSWNWTDATYLARSGAAYSVYAFYHASKALHFNRSQRLLSCHPDADKREAGKDIAPLLDAIQWRLTSDNLAAAAAGTFVWGFGDLLQPWL